MKIRKIAAGLTAVVMAAGMLSGCGKSGEKSSKKSRSKMSAPETFNSEIDKLDNSDISKRGAVNVKIIMDYKDAETKLTWDNLAESLQADSLDYDFTITGDWNETEGVFSLALAGTDVFAFGMDGDNYYIDLSQVKPGMEKAGLWNEMYSEKNNGYSVEDIFSSLKISKTEMDSIASDLSSGASLDSMTDKVKSGLSDKTVEELKKLSEKAEFEGDDIVIKGLKKADVQGLLDSLKQQYKDAAGSDSVPDLPVDSETEDNVTIDYKLSYSDDKFDQVHNFVINNDNGNVITLSFGISKPDGDIDLSRFGSAKTVGEITNNEITFEQLAKAVAMPLLGGFASGMGGGSTGYEEEFEEEIAEENEDTKDTEDTEDNNETPEE